MEHQVEQRSNEWIELRRGKLTASSIATIMVKTHKGTRYGAGRKTYMMELLAERLTGETKVFRKNRSIIRGEQMEQYAKTEYEVRNNCTVGEVGFIDHPTIPMFGCSPDGMPPGGLVEIKCLDSDNHLKFLVDEEIDNDFIWQMQTQMLITKRQWCDFISFDDRFEEGLRYKCVRIHFDLDMAMDIAKEATIFLNELDALEQELRKKLHEQTD